MTHDSHCSRCDDLIAPGEGVTVAGLSGPAKAHEECVPLDYGDFMRLISTSFSGPSQPRWPAGDALDRVGELDR